MAKKQPSLAELVRSEYGTREPKYSVKKAVPNTPVKGKRDFSVRVSDTGKPATAVEREVENVFGMQPGIQRPGLIPFRRNPVTRNIEAVAPQALYDAARAFVSPSVALQGKPMDMQDEALNFAVNFTGAGAPRALAARPLEGGAVELGVSGGRRAAPSFKDVRAPRENVHEVMQANTTAGRVVGERNRPISELTGGVSAAADDQRRVASLAKAMSSPEGYIERLIVDDAGNVIEGQHRLEALRKLGVTDVPVVEYRDFGRDLPMAEMQQAALAHGIHPDHANQIASNLAEIYADEGGNLSEILQYEAPKGFEAPWQAAVEAMAPKSPATKNSLRVVPARAISDTAIPSTTRDFSQASFDPATYGLRKTKDLPRLEASPVGIEHFRVVPQPRKVSLQDYEGRPFIISMADRSAAGDRITRIGNADLNFPVELQGGQDFMLDPTTGGLVWASEAAPVSNIMNLARQLHETTGQKPLYLPFRMGGEGSDFATMTGETMMSYADAVLGKNDKTSFNKVIKGYIPDFAGISDPKGYEQFAALPGGKRKQLQSELAVKFGEEGGGLTLPMTRAIIADPAQLDKPSFLLQNVGEIDPTREVATATGHRTYSRGVPGEALGVLGEDVNVAQLLPELSKIYKIGDPREFRGQYADFTDYGKQLKIAEEAAMREQALRQGKTPKVYNTERGGTSKYMQSGAKFGVLTPELLRALAGE